MSVLPTPPFPTIITTTTGGGAEVSVGGYDFSNGLPAQLRTLPPEDGATVKPVPPTGAFAELSAAARAIGNALSLLNALAVKSGFYVGVAASATWAGIQAAGQYGIQQVTSAISAVSNAGATGEQAAVNALNEASPGLGTAAQGIVAQIGPDSASAFNATLTEVDQIISANGEINWGAIFGDISQLPPP
jgi:hypothetical protein